MLNQIHPIPLLIIQKISQISISLFRIRALFKTKFAFFKFSLQLLNSNIVIVLLREGLWYLLNVLWWLLHRIQQCIYWFIFIISLFDRRRHRMKLLHMVKFMSLILIEFRTNFNRCRFFEKLSYWLPLFLYYFLLYSMIIGLFKVTFHLFSYHSYHDQFLQNIGKL